MLLSIIIEKLSTPGGACSGGTSLATTASATDELQLWP